jgi:hypothetical protein
MPKMEHIEDTNGADNFALATLTDADILATSLACTGGPNSSIGRIHLPGGWTISDGVELYAKKFSGVADILWADYILPSDLTLTLDHFRVEGGNFRMMVINNGQIIADILTGDHVEVLIEDITGPTYIRIAGESAAFTIAMTETEYDLFEHH